VRVGEGTQDLDLPGNALLVAALEAARRHLGRDAVAERAGATEAQRRRPAVARRIDRGEQQCGALDIVGGLEAHLCVDVTPVRRQRCERPFPRLAETLARAELLDGCLLRTQQFQLSFHTLVVEALQQPPYAFRSDRRAAPSYREADLLAVTSRIRGSEQPGCPVAARVVGDGQKDARFRPAARKLALDLHELVDESQGPEHKLTLVAKVEQKGALSSSDLREFFREMLLIRRFEEKVEERFRAGELPGFLHVAIGQEAVAVGVCRALEEGDVIASTHRAHGHALAKGTTPNELMAELYGKLEGCSHGYGGSMHLYDIERGNLGANAVVGGGLPGVVGAALAFQFRGEPRVAVAFFGDGATNIGTVHESLNLAQLWQVPVLFVCEDNHWAESTPAKQHMPIDDISQRAAAYGMKAIKVDGQDVEAVFKATRRAREHVRGGKGPVFLAVRTYRLVGHYIGDPQVYRSKEEIADVRENHDPLDLLRAKLDLSDDDLEEMDREVQEIVEASVEFAKNGTDPKPEDALKNVYA
jgi:TPP-dependent pyruvate/acetoin dehydrogenase alpha subunit